MSGLNNTVDNFINNHYNDEEEEEENEDDKEEDKDEDNGDNDLSFRVATDMSMAPELVIARFNDNIAYEKYMFSSDNIMESNSCNIIEEGNQLSFFIHYVGNETGSHCHDCTEKNRLGQKKFIYLQVLTKKNNFIHHRRHLHLV